MKHTAIKIGFQELVSLTDSYRTKAQTNTFSYWHIFWKNNMLIVAESVLLLHLFDKLIWQISAVSTADGGTWWYPPQAYHFLKVDHYLHSPFEKSIIIERPIQHIKDKTTEECFDGYFLPFKRKKCKLKHVIKWLKLFVVFRTRHGTLS